MSRWIIFYDNETTVDSDMCSWDDAPAEGVLAVVEIIGDKRNVRSGGDFYRLCPDGTVVGEEDWRTLLTQIGRKDLEPLSTIKFGRYVSASKMERVFKRVRTVLAG